MIIHNCRWLACTRDCVILHVLNCRCLCGFPGSFTCHPVVLAVELRGNRKRANCTILRRIAGDSTDMKGPCRHGVRIFIVRTSATEPTLLLSLFFLTSLIWMIVQVSHVVCAASFLLLLTRKIHQRIEIGCRSDLPRRVDDSELTIII